MENIQKKILWNWYISFHEFFGLDFFNFLTKPLCVLPVVVVAVVVGVVVAVVDVAALTEGYAAIDSSFVVVVDLIQAIAI